MSLESEHAQQHKKKLLYFLVASTNCTFFLFFYIHFFIELISTSQKKNIVDLFEFLMDCVVHGSPKFFILEFFFYSISLVQKKKSSIKFTNDKIFHVMYGWKTRMNWGTKIFFIRNFFTYLQNEWMSERLSVERESTIHEFESHIE